MRNDCILQGYYPYFVNATAGTTVAGAFDPLDAIADVCEKHGLWMHVDACWGGGALLSKKHRQLLKGVERYQKTPNIYCFRGGPLNVLWRLLID